VTLAQRFAQIFGAIYVLVGILGFIPPLLSGTIPNVVQPLDGLLLGIFAVNWIHSLAHLGIGAAGLATYRSVSGARSYSLAIGVAYGVLFLLGLVAPTVGGLLPLNAADNVLHLLTALVAFGAYFASPSSALDPRGTRV
jgi:hypothetical protein